MTPDNIQQISGISSQLAAADKIKRMRRIAFQLPLTLLSTICCFATDLGCHSSDSDAASDNSTIISGDVAKNAALARSDTDRAYALLRRGQFGDAEPLLNQAIIADPTYGPARNDLGLIYYQRDELYNAAWQFENASKLMPGEPQPQNNLGLVLERSAKLSEALKAYERACAIDPDNSEFAGNLARLRVRLNMRDETTAHLLQLIIQRDTRPDWVDWARFNLIRNASPQSAAPASSPSP